MRISLLALLLYLCDFFLRDAADAFAISHERRRLGRLYRPLMVSSSDTESSASSAASSSSSMSTAATTSSDSTGVPTQPPMIISPKDMVRLFGRLAEKYLALDASAGKCCYSGCTGCEFRLPGGGYRMAEQTAARPKWIPTYDTRATTADTVHSTKWSTGLFFTDGGGVEEEEEEKEETIATANANKEKEEQQVDDSATTTTTKVVLSKEQFLERLVALDYTPPLGGPYVGAGAAIAAFESTAVLERFYQILTTPRRRHNNNNNEDEKKSRDDRPLTRSAMKRQLQLMAAGEEGITWAVFERALSDPDR